MLPDIIRQNLVQACHLPKIITKDTMYKFVINPNTRKLIQIVENDIELIKDVRDKYNNKKFLTNLYGAMI